MENIENEIRQQNRKTVYTCSSVYHVLLAVCLILIIHDYKNFFIVMFSPSKKQLKKFYLLSERMKKFGINNIVIDKHTELHRAIGLSDIENNIVIKRVMREMDVRENDFLLVNFSWSQEMVRYPASMYLKRCKEAIFIEEGPAQWVEFGEKAWMRFLKKVYGNQLEFWKMSKIKSIYVRQITKFHDYLTHKLVEFKTDGYFEKMTEEMKDTLLGIFCDSEDKQEIEQMTQLDGIIFTQPISEDGYVTEKKKINIYTELAQFYSKHGSLALKIHPRDTTDYEMEGIRIMKGAYPSELLSILGIRFKFAIGLCTSAIETVNADIKINLNEKFLSELEYELQEIE